MYQRHPKKRDPQLVLGALRMAVNGATDIQAQLIEIETCHAAWTQTPNWQKENGRYAPVLAKWLSDEGFTQWPKGAKRESVVDPSKIVPYNPFQFSKKAK